jgi:transposase
MILDLHRQGLSVSAIALQLGIDRKTVRKYLARGLEVPVYVRGSRAPGASTRSSPTCVSGSRPGRA